MMGKTVDGDERGRAAVAAVAVAGARDGALLADLQTGDSTEVRDGHAGDTASRAGASRAGEVATKSLRHDEEVNEAGVLNNHRAETAACAAGGIATASA